MIVGIASGDYLPPQKHPQGLELWGGAGWARLGQYIPHLRASGIEVHVGIFWKNQGRGFIELSTGEFVDPDVVILQRLMHAGLDDTITKARESGQVILNDLDDWYWGLDASNAAYKSSLPKHSPNENTHHYWRVMRSSSAITVSTPFLRDKVIERGYKGPVFVLPNTVDVSRFNVVKQQDVPTFGWVGSTSHRSRDVETLRGVFPRYLREGSLRLHHSGDGSDAPSFARQIGIAPELISTSPRMTSEEYPQMLTMDVGLVPLRPCDFNRAKSDIKGLEYAASGIPFIASDLDAYRQLHNDWKGKGFILAKKPKDWFRGIDRLLDLDTRMEYQALLLNLVRKRDIALGAERLVDLLKSGARALS